MFLQGPNPIMVTLVMLLNLGLAVIFVHFLTWSHQNTGKNLFETYPEMYPLVEVMYSNDLNNFQYI